MWVLASIILIAMTGTGIFLIYKDQDFHIRLSKTEWILCIVAEIFSVFLLWGLDRVGTSVRVLILIAVLLPYLFISGISDQRYHLIYFHFIWPFMVLSMVLYVFEYGWSWRVSGCLVLFGFTWLLYLFRLYAKGDAVLAFGPGAVAFLHTGDIAMGIIASCVVLFLSMVGMVVVSVPSGNLVRGRLKQPLPLGPYLYIGTLLMLLYLLAGGFF